MKRMEPGSIDKTAKPKRKGRRLDPDTAAAMGKVSSPAKTEAVTKNAVGNKGRTGRPHTAETKTKQQAASLGNTNSVGRKLSPEHLAAMAAGRERARAEKQAKNGN